MIRIKPSINEDNGALETAKNPKEDETTPTIMSANSSVDCSWNNKVFWMEVIKSTVMRKVLK